MQQDVHKMPPPGKQHWNKVSWTWCQDDCGGCSMYFCWCISSSMSNLMLSIFTVFAYVFICVYINVYIQSTDYTLSLSTLIDIFVCTFWGTGNMLGDKVLEHGVLRYLIKAYQDFMGWFMIFPLLRRFPTVVNGCFRNAQLCVLCVMLLSCFCINPSTLVFGSSIFVCKGP